MPLATKNGSLIIKSGSIAENCRCCASGWYCYVTDGGACCEGTTCNIKPSCDCQGAGQTFKGVGTVCSPNPCVTCRNCVACVLPRCIPRFVTVSYSLTIPEHNLQPPWDPFSRRAKVPSFTSSGTVTLSGVSNSTYRCGLYRATLQGSSASSLNGATVVVEASPGAPWGFIKITKKAVANFSAADPVYTLSNDTPASRFETIDFMSIFACATNIDPLPEFLDIQGVFNLPTRPDGGVLQHGPILGGGQVSFGYGAGQAPVWYSTSPPQANISPVAVGSISVVDSYGDGIPWT